MLPLFRDGRLELAAPAKLAGCAPDQLLERLVTQAATTPTKTPGALASRWVLAIAVQASSSGSVSSSWPKTDAYAALREHCDRWGPSFIATGLFDVGTRVKALYDGELRVTPNYLSRLLNHVLVVSADGYAPTNPGALLLEIGLVSTDLQPVVSRIGK